MQFPPLLNAFEDYCQKALCIEVSAGVGHIDSSFEVQISSRERLSLFDVHQKPILALLAVLVCSVSLPTVPNIQNVEVSQKGRSFFAKTLDLGPCA